MDHYGRAWVPHVEKVPVARDDDRGRNPARARAALMALMALMAWV